MNRLILSVQADGENIFLGRNNDVKAHLSGLIFIANSTTEHSVTYVHNLVKAQRDLRSINTQFLKVRINSYGHMFVTPFASMEDMAREITDIIYQLDINHGF